MTARVQRVFQNTDRQHGCVSVIITRETAQPLAATRTQTVNKLRPRTASVVPNHHRAVGFEIDSIIKEARPLVILPL